jgi:hypothetical protein
LRIIIGHHLEFDFDRQVHPSSRQRIKRFETLAYGRERTAEIEERAGLQDPFAGPREA